MFLDSPLYLFFLCFVIFVYNILGRTRHLRLLWLLAVSYFFYFELSGWFILVLLGITAIAFFGARFLHSQPECLRTSLFFALFCILILFSLFAFKYMPALLEAGMALASYIYPVHFSIPSYAFPIGVSFFTFVALGYLIDVRLGLIEPESSPLRFALFVAFFPLISAGPIERAGRMLPQFEHPEEFSARKFINGFQWVVLGLTLKIVFAGDLIDPINSVFAEPLKHTPWQNASAALWFSYYIYADFAGYSLIAIGSALMLGFEVKPNFHQPFLSGTVSEFWRNWHISLSSWIRDYLFTPLRVLWRRYGNYGFSAALFISFVGIGLWHGAYWHYILFGAIHGTLVTASAFTLSRRDAFWAKFHAPPLLIQMGRVLITFTLVTLAFVVYRADSLDIACSVYQQIFSIPWCLDQAGRLNFYDGVLSSIQNPFVEFGCEGWLLIALVMVGDIMARQKYTLDRFPQMAQIALSSVALFVVIGKWAYTSIPQAFEYFKY